MIDKEALDILARNIEQHAFRRGYVSAFTLAAFPLEPPEELSLHITRECDGLVYGNAEIGSLAALEECMKALDGRVDYIVYDTGLFANVVHPDKIPAWSPGKSILLPYSDLDVWVASVKYTLLALMPSLTLAKIVVVAEGKKEERLPARLLMELAWYCEDIWVYNCGELAAAGPEKRQNILSGADIVIGATVYKPVVTADQIKLTGKAPLVVDAGIGTIAPEAAEFARAQGIAMIRVDNRAAMAGTLFSVIQSHDLVTRVMGEGEIDGVPVVAGGVVGAPGTVIVDCINNPVQVIGIADGTGKVRYAPENDSERERLAKVTKAVERDAGK